MATAYTPGLKVSPATVIRKTRRLPLQGDIVVKVGQEVQPDTVVARTEIPGILRTVRASQQLGIEPGELDEALLVKPGDEVERGQLLAEMKSFFGLFKAESRSPIDGTVEIISNITGHINVREEPDPIEITAYVQGKIVEVQEGTGVVVETQGAFIQGIFGVGGERHGPLRVIVDDPDQPITAADIQEDMAGAILVGGSNISGEALRRADEAGVKGIVVGAIRDSDLIEFLGYDIGVAITGHEQIDITLIVTEGFGSIRMSDRAFGLLKELDGREASINGATQIRAGVIRPEVIVPRPEVPVAQEATSAGLLDLGTPIRIIREPHFGQLATVAALPSELQVVPSGAEVRVLEAKLESGEQVTVPRANVEIVEN